MGRLIIVIVLLIVSGIIYLVKAAAGKVTGRDVKFQDESQKVMQSAAKGVQWMNDQWEKAKSGERKVGITEGKDFYDLTPTEIIAKIKSNKAEYDIVKAESTYIEIAAHKMEKRQFDDAKKLIMQLSAGEARDFMLQELEEKRHL